jgi:hypothetical protein
VNSIFELASPVVELLFGLGLFFSIPLLLALHIHILVIARLLISNVALIGVLGWSVGRMVDGRGT